MSSPSLPSAAAAAAHAPKSAEKEQQSLSWGRLPQETILDIIASVPEFDFAMLRNLQLVDRRMHATLKAYERSLCKGYATKQLLGIIPCFPDLAPPLCGSCQDAGCASSLSFKLLAEIQHRFQTVTTITDQVFKFAPVCCCVLGWRPLFEAGMLLLYRLHERSDYDDKVSFITSMPLNALVAMFITLAQSLRAAQNGGIGLIHHDHEPEDPAVRSDVHLVFEDLILLIGPEFVLHTLNHDERADQALRYQVAMLDEVQMNGQDGMPPRKSLISQLKRAFSNQAGCRIGEVMSKAMAQARTQPLRDLDRAGIARLVRFDDGVKS